MPSQPQVMTVFGTRPEAIKLAPVIQRLGSSEILDSVTVVTGQHREMLDQVNEVFGIAPDHDLDVMCPGQPLALIFGRVLEGLDKLLEADRPDAVLVQGDTSTATAAAVAAFYRQVPVVHLEAGLRSGDLTSPFPEEAHRKLVSQVASLHLAPTTRNRANLLAEGVPPESVVVTGNTVIDALLQNVRRETRFDDERIEKVARSGSRIVLVTTHRRESWGPAMHGVGRALRRLADTYPDVEVVLPAHRNPVVREAVLPHLAGAANITVTEPLPYGQFTQLLDAAELVLTDSGGIQEEAPSLGKPVLVMRDHTERPEAVDAGTVRLVGTDEDRLVAAVSDLLDSREKYEAMASVINPYGDGASARRAVAAIAHLLRLGPRPDQWTEGKS